MWPLRYSKRKWRGELSLEICGVRFPVSHHETPLKYFVSHSRLCWTPSAWSLLPHELYSWMGAEMSTNTDKTLWNPPKKPCLQCSFSHGLGLQTKHPLCLWHLQAELGKQLRHWFLLPTDTMPLSQGMSHGWSLDCVSLQPCSLPFNLIWPFFWLLIDTIFENNGCIVLSRAREIQNNFPRIVLTLA